MRYYSADMPRTPRRPIVAGIDLASAPEYGAKRYNRVGLAALAPDLTVCHLESCPCDDDRIVAFVTETRAGVVAIDAPLSLPRVGVARAVDRVMARLGFRPLWPLMPSMEAVTRRGVALKDRLERLGLTVIEVFPGAVQDLLRLPRKQAGLPRLLAGLRRLGLRGLDDVRPDGDALDALTAAYMAHLYRQGRYWAMAVPGETPLIFPDARAPGTALVG